MTTSNPDFAATGRFFTLRDRYQSATKVLQDVQELQNPFPSTQAAILPLGSSFAIKSPTSAPFLIS